MAFTATELLNISKILGITPTLLDAQIASLGSSLTADKQTAVRAEITRWDDSGAKFVRIVPKESNKGVETNSDDAKADIRKNIAVILELYDFVSYSHIGTIQIT